VHDGRECISLLQAFGAEHLCEVGAKGRNVRRASGEQHAADVVRRGSVLVDPSGTTSTRSAYAIATALLLVPKSMP